MATIGTLNEEGVNVDMYIPRKCHYSNSLIAAYDYCSVQISVGDIDPSGVYTGTTKTFCIAGYLRQEAESDHAINRLCVSSGIIRPCTGKKKKISAKVLAAAKAKRSAAASRAPVKGGKKPSATDRKRTGAPAGARKPAGKGSKPERKGGDKPARPAKAGGKSAGRKPAPKK